MSGSDHGKQRYRILDRSALAKALGVDAGRGNFVYLRASIGSDRCCSRCAWRSPTSEALRGSRHAARVSDTAIATPTNTPTATPTSTGIPLGGDCSDASTCASGFCVDGVCCDTACDGPLEQCNLPGQRGRCASVTAPAPTVSPRGLALSLVMLAGLAALALRRRGTVSGRLDRSPGAVHRLEVAR